MRDFAEISSKFALALKERKSILEDIGKGSLRPMDSTVAARQFFDLVAAEMTMEANVPFAHKPTTGEIKQRVKEAIDCFLHGYGAKD